MVRRFAFYLVYCYSQVNETIKSARPSGSNLLGFYFMKIQEAGLEYLRYLQYEKIVRPETLYSRTKEINRLVFKWHDLDVENITDDHILDLKESMVKKNNSLAYIIRMLTTVRALFTYLRDERELQVIEKVKIPKEQRKPVDYLTREQVKEMLDFSTETIFGCRLMAWILLILSSGMRISESLKLKRGQIVKEKAQGVVVYTADIEGKGGLPRKIIVQPFAMKWITAYLKMRKDDHPALFLNHNTNPAEIDYWKAEDVRYYLRQMDKRVGKRVTPHSLRRTSATLMWFKGAQEKTVKEFLGHRSLKYTDRYLGINYNHLILQLKKYVKYDCVKDPEI